jgi:hypothetical protein
MTVPPDEPTLKIIVLRAGMELTHLAETPGGSAYVETYRPPLGAIVELPVLQAEAIVRNCAGNFYSGEETAP